MHYVEHEDAQEHFEIVDESQTNLGVETLNDFMLARSKGTGARSSQSQHIRLDMSVNRTVLLGREEVELDYLKKERVAVTSS